MKARFIVSVALMVVAIRVFWRAWERFQINDIEACVAMLGCFVVLAVLAVPQRSAPSKPDKMAGA